MIFKSLLFGVTCASVIGLVGIFVIPTLRANSTPSSGTAHIPPFEIFHEDSHHFTQAHFLFSNTHDETIDVSVTLYHHDGTLLHVTNGPNHNSTNPTQIALEGPQNVLTSHSTNSAESTIKFALGPHQTSTLHIRSDGNWIAHPAAISHGTHHGFRGYGSIQWTGRDAHVTHSALVVHGYINEHNAEHFANVEVNVTTLHINGGRAF